MHVLLLPKVIPSSGEYIVGLGYFTDLQWDGHGAPAEYTYLTSPVIRSAEFSLFGRENILSLKSHVGGRDVLLVLLELRVGICAGW